MNFSYTVEDKRSSCTKITRCRPEYIRHLEMHKNKEGRQEKRGRQYQYWPCSRCLYGFQGPALQKVPKALFSEIIGIHSNHRFMDTVLYILYILLRSVSCSQRQKVIVTHPWDTTIKISMLVCSLRPNHGFSLHACTADVNSSLRCGSHC